MRRSDYLLPGNIDQFGTLESTYYQPAIEYISKNVKNPHFFFFSDDIEWVKKNIKTAFPSVYLSYSPHEDLFIMSLCKHNIIANSSFSWWGAWLNENPNKIVVAPKKWFIDGRFSPIDSLPQNWYTV